MANCGSCGKDVGCGCNLVEGKCISCYSKANPDEPKSVTKVKKARYIAPPKEAGPLKGFDEILQNKGLSREEKLRRINNILEEARQKYLT